MKYRHAYHAGNFADVHKHVTLLALIRALSRKEKGFLFLDTHAGRGRYDLRAAEARKTGESAGGIGLLETASENDSAQTIPAEIADYLQSVKTLRKSADSRHSYPGSPLLALHAVRPQDRVVLIETQAEEHRALREAANSSTKAAIIECADGYARLGAWLPPIERRALLLIDPPFEDSSSDFRYIDVAVGEALRRLPSAVIAVWYPIKYERDTRLWRERLSAKLPQPADSDRVPILCSELWIHPRDSRVGLNGSGMLIVNPPWQIADRMREWLPWLYARLDPQRRGGCSVSGEMS